MVDNSSKTATNTDRLDSFHPECNDLKHQYDQCFNFWFREHYMNGNYNNNVCHKVFEMYTDCVKVSIILHCRFIIKCYSLFNFKQRGMKEYGLQYEEVNLEANREKSPHSADTGESKVKS